MLDVIIIGAGITGSMIARELSKYKLSVMLLDKCGDVGNVTSSANSAIIHSGYDPVPNSLKAKLNVKGCLMYPSLCKDLDVPFIKTGTLTIMQDPSQEEAFNELVKRSALNGVDIEVLDREEILKLEPNINPNVIKAIYAKEAGIVNPFELVPHIVESAVNNGVTLKLNTEVTNIIFANDVYYIETSTGIYETKCVINAAGLFADKISLMVEETNWSINPRKGEYIVLDHKIKNLVNRPIFPLPSEKGKGILVAPTTSGNYYLGPTSESVDSRSDYSTDALTLDQVKKGAELIMPKIPYGETIRVFAGLRATPSTHDFIIESLPNHKTFINVAGIESPGLASSPAIAKYVIDNFVSKIFTLEKNETFVPSLKPRVRLNKLSIEERNKKIKENPKYGTIICQCEQISLGEIIDELDRGLPINSLKSLKRRLRTGFGKCQGGYCFPRLLRILCDYYHISPSEVNYDNNGSNIILDEIKK